jgi:hypothetical protein
VSPDSSKRPEDEKPSGGAESVAGPENPAPAGGKEWLSVVEEKVRQLRFGVVQLTIHEGKVVQIDSTERTRIEIPSGPPRRQRGGFKGTSIE